jgi:hypothetical protein
MSDVPVVLAVVRKIPCAICNSDVILDQKCDPWTISCKCGTVEVPKWVQIDAYSQRQFRRQFEIRFIRLLGQPALFQNFPKETEG